MSTIEHMTLEELQRLIDERIDERVDKRLFGFRSETELEEKGFLPDNSSDLRTWEQVKQDVKRHRWTPPPGAKSPLELLREDRDR